MDTEKVRQYFQDYITDSAQKPSPGKVYRQYKLLPAVSIPTLQKVKIISRIYFKG